MCDMAQPKAPRGSKSAPLEVTKMVRKWIREQEQLGRKPGEIAAELGVTRTQVVNVRDETRGVGSKMEEGFARVRFNGSLDALRQAARGEPAEVRFVADHIDEDEDTKNTIRYAIETERCSQEAVDEVLSNRPGGTDGYRMSPAELLDEIRVVDRRLKRERRVGKDEVRRGRGEKEVTDELD
jgi:hypothetical protein